MKIKILYILLIFIILTEGCEKKDKTDSKKTHRYILIDINTNPVPLPEDKLIVLNFMAYSCSACIEEIPVMKKVIQEEEFRDKFQIIGMVIDSKTGDLSDPLFPIYPNHRQNFVRFPVPGTPTTYIITPRGKKLIIIYGAVTEEKFRKFLREALRKAMK